MSRHDPDDRGEGLWSVDRPMPLLAVFEHDFMVEDVAVVLVHFRRQGSTPGVEQFAAAARPGIASWAAGRQAWGGAQHRKWSGAIPQYTTESTRPVEHR